MARIAVHTALCLAACAAAHAQKMHWPQFRGIDGQGLAKSAAPVDFGPETNVVWKTAIPAGHSSPVIVDNLIFLTGEEGGQQAKADRDKITTDGKLITFAVNRTTGKVAWRQEIPRPRLEKYQPTNSAASPSVVSDGRNIYAFFGDFGMISYTHGGKERWRRPLGPFNNVNGHGSSPVIVGNRVFLICDQDSDSFLIAFDKDTGKTAWRVERPGITRSYSTPAVYRPKNGPAELIVPGAYVLTSYELETGKKLWWVTGQSWQPKSVPIVLGDTIYSHSWENGGEAEATPPTPDFAPLLEKFDKNGDGALTEAEFEDKQLARGFVNTDLDNNGKIDKAEWDNLRARRSSRNVIVAVRGGGRGDITNTHVTWSMQKFLPNVPSPLIHDGVMYLIKDGGVLTALDADTGKIYKQGRLTGALETYYASPVAAGGHIYFLSQHGKAAVVKAGREWELVKVHDMGEDAFATPAVVDGNLYLRTRGTLYCFADKSARSQQ